MGKTKATHESSSDAASDSGSEEPRGSGGIDRSAIRQLLALTPEERIRSAVADAKNLRRFDLAAKVTSKGR